MRKTVFLALIGACVCIFAALATSCKGDDPTPTGTVMGTITSVLTGEGIPGAKVSIAADGLETTTGSDGSYMFRKVEAGTK